ncbi:polysaccharide lyase family 8 super-sandwich domain-containing protein [Pseudomonas viridiflava]|uniref:polysaccharide lyase family 8 super-sandwich domain-containing protein n=1 Tax=Pseudomonas viridiflava TaxID=33069 RepID=UPI001C31846C|nr:polysaccharide lyase family 8 super-sandwich domain-containing protein [Pseudomonas viridiflava]QXG49046.1 silent information regulator protein Sir2 [Pseudomonas viridiflava]
MDASGNWVALGDIRSDRDLVSGEQVQVMLVDRDSGDPVEEVRFSPLPDQQGQYGWTKFFADHINTSASHLRAGVQQADGSFKTEYSGYLNRLWTEGETSRSVITTACRLDEWSDLYTINSYGSLPAGTSITCQLANARTGDSYQALLCEPPPAQSSRYAWPACLSRAINDAGELLRAGEKDTVQKMFVPVDSGYRNHIWAPGGMTMSLQWDVTISAAALESAESVYEGLCAQFLKSPPTEQIIDAWLTGFAGGRFQDISYPASGSTVDDVSGLTEHLDRIVRIASYLFKRGSAFPALYLANAMQALNFYAAQDYRISHWWSRQIAMAKQAGIGAVLLAKYADIGELMESFVPYAMRTTNTYGFTQTGANLADFASVQILWSVCAWKTSGRGEYLLYLRASADVLSELCYPVQREGKEHGEGVRVDYSISQHNARNGSAYCSQLYSGSYGGELLGRIFDNLAVLTGAFALASGARGHLVRVVIDGLGWMGYARRLDFHVNGRAISRGVASTGRFAGWAEALMPLVGDADRTILVELIRRVGGDEVRNEHYRGGRIFWTNDYLAHIGAGFCLWAKAVSTRTVGGECGNGENPKGYYMGAGTYFLTRHGGEYEGIQPVWDWQRLPGTTVEQVPDFTWPDITWGANMWGSHAFCGGVSDGKKSLLSMELSRKNITHAYKTVMTLDDRVTCIGSRINSSTAKYPVVTSVNQCIARGPVSYVKLDGTAHTVALGDTVTASDIRAVHHDGFVYTLGNIWLRQSVSIELKNCSGAWADINVNGSPDRVTLPVFSLWINHASGENGSYLYDVHPGEALTDNVSILKRATSSTDEFHVSGDEQALMVSCFSTASNSQNAVTGEQTFYPEQPCSYIYALTSTDVHLTCADPTQTLEKLSFIVEVDESGSALRRIEVSLPQGEDRGRSITGVYSIV